MENQLTLSVIVVNYKTADLTIQTIKTLIEKVPHIFDFAEIIVVDNASGDDSVEKIQRALPQVELIENEYNTGFSGGNNVGMKQARGEYVLLLNSDTISIEDPVTALLSFMDEHKNVGLATIQLLYEDKTIQPTGGFFPTIPRVFFWMFFLDDIPFFNSIFTSFHPDSRSYNKDKPLYQKERKLDWITGAFFMMRRDVIEKIGYFDENMFMYAEEMEYCYRAYKKGFSCYYLPIAKIIHLQGKSSTGAKNALLGEYKNILYFYKKHHSNEATIIVRWLLKIGAILRIVLFGTILRKPEVAKIYVEAFSAI